ncbi:MAG: glycosyltransferase family 39 protein [Anaerolineae bacterium]|nr:glycosyltransferase family 39 protein [Anaerolineae bacterium]
MALRRLHAAVSSGGPALPLLLTLLALGLRAARLDFQPLWWDEGYSVWFARHPLAEMVRLTAQDIHPPLYYALLGGWIGLVGPGPVALRLFSVAVGVLTVPLIYAVARRLGGPQVGVVAALLVAVNPLHVFYSQEVRMYALVALAATAAVGAAAAWLGLAAGGRGRGRAGWLLGYVAAMAVALYTQYYAGFLLAGLALAGLWTLWRARANLRLAAVWLAAQGAVVLLYLPWLRFATPQLVAYVSQKVVADADRPLGPLTYLARHLAAYVAGHLEGPLAPWWPVALLALVPLAAALWRARRSLPHRHQPSPPDRSPLTIDHRPLTIDHSPSPPDRSPLTIDHWPLTIDHSPSPPDHRPLTTSHWPLTIDHWPLTINPSLSLFLLLSLAVVLALGWLVNLTFPFFPERGERLLLLGLPLFLLLAALALSTSGSRWGLAPFLLLAVASLAAFYTVPRYADEDYRPLIGQVNLWGRRKDAVLAIYPWQVGYLWSYGRPDGPQPALAVSDQWGPDLAAQVDEALARGHLWFPEHLSLGGLLEGAVEGYLAESSYLLLNRWYSPSTRLTGWAQPVDGGPLSSAGPLRFEGGELTSARMAPMSLQAANQALLVDLAWRGEAAATRLVSLRLADREGRTWAQADFRREGEEADRLGLLVPAGTPPGQYDLRLSARPDQEAAAWSVVGPDGRPQGKEAVLGQVAVAAAEETLDPATLPIAHPRQADLDGKVRLLGYSATEGELAPGEDLDVSLFWQALPGLAAARQPELFAFVQLLDRAGGLAAAWEGPPVAWYPTGAWRPGELVRSQHTLRLPATVADGRYRLIVGLFEAQTGRRLATAGGLLRRSADHVALTEVEVRGRAHRTEPPQPQHALFADLAEVGRLVGYDLSDTELTPGQALTVTLHWQATEATGQRWAVFVHLVEADGSLLAQSDSEPGAGQFPTSGWLPGEYLADRHVLTVRGDAEPGPAVLRVGLYDQRTGQRLPWVDAAGRPVGDALTLPTAIRVER